MSTFGLNSTPFITQSTDLESLKSQRSGSISAEKQRLAKAAEEFESFFMYYMLKTMRETIPDSPLGEQQMLNNSASKDIFNQMFDMELSKKLAGGNGSIARMLYNQMERLIDQKTDGASVNEQKIRPLESGDINRFKLNHRRSLPIDKGGGSAKPIEPPVKFHEVSHPITTRPTDPIVSSYGSIIEKAAKEHKIEPALIYSVIKVESNGDPNAESSAGARGLMQLGEATASDMGVADSFDPTENIHGGAKYLKRMLDRYGDLNLALAAYNAGPGNVDRHGGVPPFRETQEYIVKVNDTLQTARLQLRDDS
jgi:Rod binding domain-containing protein